MGAADYQQMADRVARLLEDKLNVRGRGLADKLRRAGRRLPKPIRIEATLVAEAAAQAPHPKLLAQIDTERVTMAYDACIRHLTDLDRAERRKVVVLNALTSAAFAVFVTALVVLVFGYWRGLI
jgi:hypothetical protein